MALLPFPLNLANTVENSAYPAICFTHHAAKNNRPGDRIFLPMPPGIEIADAMAYSTVNLGIIGNALSGMVQGMTSANSPESLIANAVAEGGKSIAQLKNANAAAAASIYTRERLKSEQYANVIDFASKQIISPNTNTTFQGSNVRSYNFKFKMVARSAAESNRIKTIVDKFRLYMYPMGNDLLQEYPGSWQISFVFGTNKDSKNKFIPEPYRCYLTNFTSTYNAGNNMWHEDGAPVEVDIAMNFQEIKALTRQHIDSLNNQIQLDNPSTNPAPVV